MKDFSDQMDLTVLIQKKRNQEEPATINEVPHDYGQIGLLIYPDQDFPLEEDMDKVAPGCFPICVTQLHKIKYLEMISIKHCVIRNFNPVEQYAILNRLERCINQSIDNYAAKDIIRCKDCKHFNKETGYCSEDKEVVSEDMSVEGCNTYERLAVED